MALNLLLLGLLASSMSTEAQTLSDAENYFLEGVQHYKEGNLAKAIDALEQAMDEDRHPVLIYNLAMLYDRQGQHERAISLYEEYLDTQPEDGLLIELRLHQLKPDQAAPKPKERIFIAPAQPKPIQEDPGISTLTYSFLGAGTLSLIAGGVLGAMTLQDVDGLIDAKVREDGQAHADAARTHQLYANASFATAVLSGAAALVSYLLQDTPSRTTTTTNTP